MTEHSLTTENDQLRGTVIVVTGVIIISFDALFVRLAAVDGWNVCFWRGLFIAISLFVLSRLGVERTSGSSGYSRVGLWLAATLMAASSLCLVLAFTLTQAANAVVILSASPLFAALTSQIFLGENCPLRTWIAILVCIGGVCWVMSGSLESGDLLGDGLAVASTFFIGGYFTVFRRFPQVPRSKALIRGGLLLCLLSLPFATPLSLPGSSYGWLMLAGFIQMPVALLLITTATRYLPAAEVSLFLLLETCLAPIWVWLALGEVPPLVTFLGGMLIVTTLSIHTLTGMKGRMRTG